MTHDLTFVQEKMFAMKPKSLAVSHMARPPSVPNPKSVFSQRLHALIDDQFEGSRKAAAKEFGLSRTHLSRVVVGGHHTQAATVALICRRVNSREAVVGLIEGFLIDQLRLVQKGLRKSEWSKRKLVEIMPVKP
jgi:hypothetical protein